MCEQGTVHDNYYLYAVYIVSEVGIIELMCSKFTNSNVGKIW